MNSRTILDIPARPDFGPILDGWAAQHGYNLQREENTPDGPARLYQKGTGLMVAPMMLRVTAGAQTTRLEAYIYSNMFVRVMSLMMLPEELGIGSAGFKGAIPKGIARKAVNVLLAQLGANPIP